jgi:hypothetical protein
VSKNDVPGIAESRQCSIVGCLRESRSRNMCTMHYFRWRRQGNPYVKVSRARCDTCLEAVGILKRRAETKAELLDQVTDLFLLFKTGSTYRLKDYDDKGRERESDIVRKA